MNNFLEMMAYRKIEIPKGERIMKWMKVKIKSSREQKKES